MVHDSRNYLGKKNKKRMRHEALIKQECTVMYRYSESQIKPTGALFQQPSPTQQDDKRRLPQVRREYSRYREDSAALSENRITLQRRQRPTNSNMGGPITSYITGTLKTRARGIKSIGKKGCEMDMRWELGGGRYRNRQRCREGMNK